MNSSVLLSSSSSPPNIHALDVDYLLEEIFSHIGTGEQLLNYRLVCHKWNDVIVGMVTKSKSSFKIPLRFGKRVPLFLISSDAVYWAKVMLKRATTALTGTATSLPFDTVVIDRDFYLIGVMTEWTNFLERFGESIRHLNFNIRSGEGPGENENFVTDCKEIVSLENLKTTLFATPNLESLDLCIRFSESGSGSVAQRTFPKVDGDLDPDMTFNFPHLQNLAKIMIQEPEGTYYSYDFILGILRMAPNLSTLQVKWSTYISTYLSVLKVLPNLKSSLKTIGIGHTTDSMNVPEIELMGLSHFEHLTRLELDNVYGTGGTIGEILKTAASTLKVLIVGNRRCQRSKVTHPPGFIYHNISPYVSVFSLFNENYVSGKLMFPPIMESLEILEVNLAKFEMKKIQCYRTQFPKLMEITVSCCVDTDCWTLYNIGHLLPGEPGQSFNVNTFTLLGRMWGREKIIQKISATFPSAQHKFYSRLPEVDLTP